MRNKKIRELTLFSMIFAIVFVLTLPPYIGYVLAINFLGVKITIIHIPIIIGAIVLKRRYAYLLGLVFGLSSLWAAFMSGDIMFQNIFIAVIPRIIFGFFIYEIFVFLSRIIKKEVLKIGLTLCISTITHTILVLFAIYLFGAKQINVSQDAINDIILKAASFNALIEIIISIIIGLPLTKVCLELMKNEE